MKKLQGSLTAKIIAIFLCTLFLTAAVGAAGGCLYMESKGYYNSEGFSFYDSELCAETTRNYADTAFYDYFSLAGLKQPTVEDTFNLQKSKDKLFKENKNFFFTIADEKGTVLSSYYKTQNYGTQSTYSFGDNGQYTLNAYVKDPISAGDNYDAPRRTFETLYSVRYLMIAAAAALSLLSLILFIYLMCAAGHRNDKEEVTLNFLDRIPLDLFAAGILAAAFILLQFCGGIWNSLGSTWMQIAALSAFCAPAILLALASCLTFATRVKIGKWWENTIIWRTARFFFRAIGLLLKNMPLLWKTVLGFGAYLFFNMILVIALMDTGGQGLGIILGFLFNLGVLLLLCFGVLQMQRIKLAGQKIAGGDLGWRIDTEKMLPDIKAHAENLNNINAGMARAVDQQMKSERFKTELITNVSHDLKTPLTSIINYVDLLKKEPIDNENIQSYIEVLERQSARLKKLTEDLIEASKASTGNTPVELVRTNVIELLNQSVGEYTERFAEEHLEIVISTAQKEAAVMADGKLLWRVFDNLLNNILKYSQPDTRVYIDVESAGGKVTITLRNISKYPLNITADELLERFIRGDSSRATEGSGLGLSIAQSLTELQKGRFDLSVDGDLFKAAVSFDIVK